MRIRLYTFWAQLSGSFWFIPALMVAGALLLGWGMISLDRANLQSLLSNFPGLYAGSPDGARSLLSTIAGSMISVAGVTFSITIATLSLASSQLGPRLLSNFMRDRGNQIVLGTFVSIFVYCLIVLRAISSSDGNSFVPHLSVFVALVLAVTSVAVLIYFFHHVSTMIQAPNVIAAIGQDLDASIKQLVAANAEAQPYEAELRSEDDLPEDFDNKVTVQAKTSGYLQAVDYEALQTIAIDHEVLLHVLYKPGDFIAERSDIVGVYPSQSLSDAIETSLRDTFTIGIRRLDIQNIEFEIDQLVEVAVRALSPGINDPFTAIACLDQLGVALSHLAEQTIPPGYYYDADGHLRLVSEALIFSGLVETAFNKIRQYGRTDIAVMIRLLEVIALVTARAQTDAQKQALTRQADMVMRASSETVFEPNDLRDIENRYQLAVKAQHENHQ